MRHLLLIILSLLLCSTPPTQAIPGVSSKLAKPVKEATEWSIEKLTQAARKIATLIGRPAKEVDQLTARYGDDAIHLLCNQQRISLCLEMGDDAAKALIKHGNTAESILTKINNPELARILNQVDHSSARSIDIMIQKGHISPENAPSWISKIQKNGTALLTFASKHGIITAAALAICFKPELALDGLTLLMDTTHFIQQHPYWTGAIILIALYLYQQITSWLAKSPLLLLRYLGKTLRLPITWLLRLRRKKKTPGTAAPTQTTNSTPSPPTPPAA